MGPKNWGTFPSRHPETSPYFLEFLPLIKYTGGLDGYDRSMAFDRFIPNGGLQMDLSRQEFAYVKRLVEVAQCRGQVPVLTCARTLGRIAGLKRAFGGSHIFLHRNLYQQWNSYSSQQRLGNPYFVKTLLTCLQTSQHDPFMAVLAGYARRQAGAGSDNTDLDSWLGRLDTDDLFVLFVAFHVYLYMWALGHADIIIDVTKLARHGAKYRLTLETDIRKVSGLTVDLSDVKDAIEVPLAPIRDLDAVRLKLEAFCTLAVSMCRAAPEQIAFGKELIAALWREHAQFSFYTRSFTDLFSQQAFDLGSGIRRLEDKVSDEKTELVHQAEAQAPERDQLNQQIAGITSSRDRASDETLNLQSRFDKLASEHAELSRYVEGVTDDRDRLSSEKAELVHGAEALAAQRDQLHLQIADITSSRDRLSGETLNLQNRFDKLASEHAELSRHVEAITGDRDRLSSEKVELAHRAEALVAERDQLHQQIADITSSRDRLSDQTLNLQSRLDKLASEHAELSRHVEAITGDRDRLSSEMSISRTALVTAERQTMSLRNREGGLLDQIALEQRRVFLIRAEIEALREQVARRTRKEEEFRLIAANAEHRTAVLQSSSLPGMKAIATELIAALGPSAGRSKRNAHLIMPLPSPHDDGERGRFGWVELHRRSLRGVFLRWRHRNLMAARARLVRGSGLFDANWYRERYKDVAAAGVDPLQHFLRHGSAEIRSPGPTFDSELYLARNPDVAASRMEPLFHYLVYGRFESRVEWRL